MDEIWSVFSYTVRTTRIKHSPFSLRSPLLPPSLPPYLWPRNDKGQDLPVLRHLLCHVFHDLHVFLGREGGREGGRGGSVSV